MTYRRALITSWSRRDRLAVLVVAVTVGFLVGTALVVVAGGAQTAALAADFDTAGTAVYVDDPGAVESNTESGALVLPLAVVDDPDGERTIAVGVPDGTERMFGDSDRTIARDGETTLGTIDEPEEHTLEGDDGSATVVITSRSASVFPDEWYVTSPAIVDELGSTAAVVIDEQRLQSNEMATTVPLRSALAFFATGTDEALRVLAVLGAASGLLVGVTVYSVTRMSVVDRRRDIEVVRATGGTPGAVLGAFAARAFVLSSVGAAAGYAIGAIGVSVAVNVAVVTGVPTSISPRVTADVAAVLVPLVVSIPAVGTVAGVAAAWPAVSSPPSAIGRLRSSPLDRLAPQLLGARVLVPTTATLAAFAAFALLFAAGVGVVGPMIGGGEAIVTEAGSSNPVNSQLPAGYTDAFEAQDIDASAEILLFSVVDGRPVQARGAEFDAFAAVSDAELVEGRPPEATDEAVVGTEVARTLDVEPGDSLPLGGSTRVGTTRVTVVGTFEAPTPYGDHVVVSLPTARHLTGVADGHANVIRGEEMPTVDEDRRTTVTGLDTETPVVGGEPVEATVHVTNYGLDETTETITVSFGDQKRTVELTLEGAAETEKTVEFDPVEPGEIELRAGNETRTVSVSEPGEIELRAVPTHAPPGTEPQVRVVDVRGDPVANASVTVDGRTSRTDGDGTTRLSLAHAGDHQVVAEHDGFTATESIAVSSNASRAPFAELSMPSTVDLLVRPTATVGLTNPWNETVTSDVSIVGPDGETRRSVTLDAGASTTVDEQFDRHPVGEYTVAVNVDDRPVDERSYRIAGDERVAAALASRGVQQKSPFEQAIEVAFGNVQLLGATLIGLAGVMAVGATTASFAGAVHARREAIGVHRALGASPTSVVWLVLRDAFKLGALAAVAGTVLAMGVLWLLDAVGLLRVFGVRLLSGVDPAVVFAVIVAALVVALVGAATAIVSTVSASPASLLSGRTTDEDDSGFDA